MDVLLQAEVVRTRHVLSRIERNARRLHTLVDNIDSLSVKQLDELIDLLLQARRMYGPKDFQDALIYVRELRMERSGFKSD